MSETIRLGHLVVESPYANAGGVVKTVEDVARMSHAGTGWIEGGSWTMEKRLGNGANGEVTYVHDPVTRTSWNSGGMENRGIDAVVADMPDMLQEAHRRNKPLIANVAPVTPEPEEEAVELVTRAYEAGADAVLLNAGCPNVITEDGGREENLSQNPARLFSTLAALKPVTEKYHKIFLRLSPLDLFTEKTDAIYRSIALTGVTSVLFKSNTWDSQRPPAHLPQLEVPGEVGGMSGPSTFDRSLAQAVFAALRMPDLQVVMSSGIADGKSLHRAMTSHPAKNIVAGAGTTFFYESGDWEHDVDRLLYQYMDATE